MPPDRPPADELAATATASAEASPGAAQLRCEPPAMLGRYRLDHKLGAGGMGVVHAALDLDLERPVAIKLLHAGPSETTRARLLREARAMARIDHPNVVRIFEVDSIDGIDFVVMELVEGSSLADWLRAGARSRAEILEAFGAAGRGLGAAHAAGMVHRDFKPHNVLRSRVGRILVTDFGLARESHTLDPAAPAEGVITPSPLDHLTQTGALVGTPAYMAPEQWARGAISPAVDQFAFCVALWEALAGERPFRGDALGELRAAVERGPGAADATRIPRELRGALLRGLDPDPQRRWPSLDALLGALTPRRRRRLPLAAVAVLALGLGGAALAIGSTEPATPTPPAPPATTPAAPDDLGVVIPKTHDELIASIVKVAEGRYEVPRATVDQLLSDRSEFAEGATTVAVMKDDAMHGFRLLSVRPRSVFTAFGLKNFDVLRSVNDIPLTSTERLIELHRGVRTAAKVVVDYERGGSLRRLDITVDR